MNLPASTRLEIIASLDPTAHYAPCWLTGSELVATNGKALVSIPVQRDEGDVGGVVPCEALVAARKSHFTKTSGMAKIELNGSAIVADTESRQEFPRPPKTCPDVASIVRDAKAAKHVSVILNAALLKAIQDSIGCDALEIQLDAEAPGERPVLVLPDWNEPTKSRSPKVRAEGAFGIIMPISAKE